MKRPRTHYELRARLDELERGNSPRRQTEFPAAIATGIPAAEDLAGGGRHFWEQDTVVRRDAVAVTFVCACLECMCLRVTTATRRARRVAHVFLTIHGATPAAPICARGELAAGALRHSLNDAGAGGPLLAQGIERRRIGGRLRELDRMVRLLARAEELGDETRRAHLASLVMRELEGHVAPDVNVVDARMRALFNSWRNLLDD